MHGLHIWEKVNSLTESQYCINPIWLNGVPQWLLCYMLLWGELLQKIAARQAYNASQRCYFLQQPFPQKGCWGSCGALSTPLPVSGFRRY